MMEVFKYRSWNRKTRTDSNYDRLSASGTLKSLRRNSPSVSRLERTMPENSSSQHLSASSRIASFFTKRSFRAPNPLKRTKSVTKLDRKSINGLDHTDLQDTATNASRKNLLAPYPAASRVCRSHESIIAACRQADTPRMSDGSIPVNITRYVGVDNDWKYYDFMRNEDKENCGSTNTNAPRFVYPDQSVVSPKRTDHLLKIWLQEAKGLPAKKRYYCEIFLDQTLYARTSVKVKQELCFWGEQFEFAKLPAIQTLEVHLYREVDSKKRKKEKQQLIGKVIAPIGAVSGGAVTERWYPVILERNSGVKSDDAAIRIKARHQVINILPLEKYSDLVEYLKLNYAQLCRFLEPRVGIKAKEELATTMVHIMHKLGLSSVFLVDVVMEELNVLDDYHLTFRGNSLATKSMEAFLKLAGNHYLNEALGDLIRALMEAEEDCEVDSMKLSPDTSLPKQQETLMIMVEMTWAKIMNSARYFPPELREVFQTLRERLTAAGRAELADTLISGCIFLRFLCPAVLSPSMFGLVQEYPNQKIARNLTLIAKTVQTLANFARFNGKESYMEFMNTFVERELPSMRTFLKLISSPMPMNMNGAECNDDHVDLGRELSSLHTLLRECLLQSNTMAHRSTLKNLPEILQTLTDQLALSMRVTQPSADAQYATYLSREVQEQLLARLQNMNGTVQNGCHDCLQATGHSRGSLPNTNYHLGGSRSGQRPLRNASVSATLDTADDYVLFSAIDGQSYTVNGAMAAAAASATHHQKHQAQRDATSAGSSPRDSLRMNHRESDDKARKSPVKLTINGDYVDLIGLGREERGSQTSISQLSSGYQSSSLQARQANSNSSQSCSPMEISTDISPHNTSKYAVNPNRKSYMDSSDHNSRARLSSSSDSAASSMSTPPRDRRTNFSAAPRTNPHCSQNGSLPVNATPPSPKLGIRAFGDTEKRNKLKCRPVNRHASSSPDRISHENVGSDRDTKQYELEIDQLRSQLQALQVKLQEAERKLSNQEQTTEKVILDWKAQIEAGEERVKKEQIEKDLQMKSIVVRLISVEEELRREQSELMGMMRAKQKVIEAQEKKIESLNSANQRLVATLAQLKESSPLRTRNGATGGGRTSPYPNPTSGRMPEAIDALSFLNLPETKELRSSSC
ncbi:hypothetical protein RvY_13106-2 [Ramazzottius varieornatus]|uniref:Uncharacterized protein n=1 Tax=Ramazzottius varieornatus TaxID=947166 RepID=A0A1D1VLS3_RAMVA|nr:hypothetical protein RvY_13106-2 [Ramazzottius varieornatus]